MPGLIGFRGQGMATRKVIIPTLVGKVSTSRVGSLTLTEDLLAASPTPPRAQPGTSRAPSSRSRTSPA